MALSRNKVGLYLTLAFCLLSVLTCAIGGWMVLDVNSPLNRRSALNATIDWARTAPLPTTASDVDIVTDGSSFTREFTVSFKDTPANIAAWIAASPGPSSVSPIQDASGWDIYDFPAGSGAVYAQVRVSPAGDEVVIHTYWS